MGKWWGTRASVTRGGVAVANPCVQSTPCTWTQVLATFPNVGVHATYGAIVLKAGSGWANFRGNVDSLVIGINGASTTFDFDPVGALRFRLQAEVGAEVVSPPWASDTTYPRGALVPYSFAARPGRASPIVILDDTLAALSGTIVMDRNHTLDVESDTIYSYATLQPLERSLADLNTALLTAGDKAVANQSIIDFMLGQIAGGVDPAVLAQASTVAAHIAIDPVRDAAALDAVDAALAGKDFYIDIYADGTFGTYYEEGPPELYAARIGSAPLPSGAIRSRSATPAPRTKFARRIGPALVDLAPRNILLQTHASREALANPEDPMEYTKIVFTNGIWNDHLGATATRVLVAKLAQGIPRFKNDWTTVVLHYNTTRSVQMRAYDDANPCGGFNEAMDWKRPWSFTKVVAYNVCKGRRLVMSLSMADLVESVRLRQAAAAALPVPDAVVTDLAKLVRALRRTSAESHVILVGHSEGTIIDALALQKVAQLEGRPINTANRCVAAIALAPATSRASYGLDQYHLNGILADFDVLKEIGISNPLDWQRLATPVTAAVGNARTSRYFVGAGATGLVALGSMYVHQAQTYLTGAGGVLFQEQLIRLHKECIPGSGSLTVDLPVAPVGSNVQASVIVTNQNGRTLLGRRTTPGSDERVLKRIDSTTFLAYAPRDTTPYLGVSISPNLYLSAPVTIPVVSVQIIIAERDTSNWVVIEASNGGLGSPAPGQAPTDPWDGAEGSCYQERIVPGEGASYVKYQLRCGRRYTIQDNLPTTLVSGLPIVASSMRWTGADGVSVPGGYVAACGPERCWRSVTVELFDGTNHVVGRGTAAVP